MFGLRITVVKVMLLALVPTAVLISASRATAQNIGESTPTQTNLTRPSLNFPANLSNKLTPRQQELLKRATPEQLETLMTTVRPAIMKRLQEESAKRDPGSIRGWRDIIRGESAKLSDSTLSDAAVNLNRSAAKTDFNFSNNDGTFVVKPTVREFHGITPTDVAGQKARMVA
jgi:hypothetical protein